MQPLANDLGLTVDISCDRDDPKCVRDVVDDYDGPGNILICVRTPPEPHDLARDKADQTVRDSGSMMLLLTSSTNLEVTMRPNTQMIGECSIHDPLTAHDHETDRHTASTSL